jgi:hypothetical protein
MPARLKWPIIIISALVVLFLAYRFYFVTVVNPRVVEELHTEPQGTRAARVMLLSLPDGKQIPVNYLMEGNKVFAGADGRWWQVFTGEGIPVIMLIKGQELKGHGIVILDNQPYVDDVFSRLRPAAPDWLPDWLNGKLVEITIKEKDAEHD